MVTINTLGYPPGYIGATTAPVPGLGDHVRRRTGFSEGAGSSERCHRHPASDNALPRRGFHRNHRVATAVMLVQLWA